jgi:signal peptidase I
MTQQAREHSKLDLTAEVLYSFGKVRLRLAGISMLPTLWPGDLLTIEPVDIEQVMRGHLVLYMRENRLVVHRAVECVGGKEQCLWTTRGDALFRTDHPVTAEELLGRVVKVSRCGQSFAPAASVSHLARFCGLLLYSWDQLRGWLLRFHSWRSRSGVLDVRFDEICVE